MSIVKPCPYDINGEHCKYEIYYGEPIFSKCKNCSRTRTIFKRCIEMTEKKIKELAREYINGCTERAGFVILTEGIVSDFIDLFVAGFMKCLELKAGRPQWHKVADGDLPKAENHYWSRNVLFQTNKGSSIIGFYDHANKAWYEKSTNDMVWGVIAWCEIPEYTEE